MQADHAVQYALAQIGKPYQRGATGPHAFDSAGLIHSAYLAAGINAPRAARKLLQYKVVPTIGMLQPGDLVFRDPIHVMLYVGEGKALEVAGPGKTVSTVKVPRKPYRLRRVTTPGGGAGLSQATPGIVENPWAPTPSRGWWQR